MKAANNPAQAPHVQIIAAHTAQHYTDAKALMEEYRELALAEDYHIAGASLNEELAQFPNPYVPPQGCILLAYRADTPVGCLAIRPISQQAGEVMRMYVKQAARGLGIANQLMVATLQTAKDMGYAQLYLDSLDRFKEAHALYRKHGFEFCEPYDPTTTEAMKIRMVFMRKIL